MTTAAVLEARAGAREPRPLNALEWLRYGPFLVQLVVIRRCNLGLRLLQRVRRPFPAGADRRAQARHRQDRRAGRLGIVFTGGEPTMHPDLVELVAYAKRKGFAQRKMITNA